MRDEELAAIRKRDAKWQPRVGESNANQACRDRRVLLAKIEEDEKELERLRERIDEMVLDLEEGRE